MRLKLYMLYKDTCEIDGIFSSFENMINYVNSTEYIQAVINSGFDLFYQVWILDSTEEFPERSVGLRPYIKNGKVVCTEADE